MKTADEIDAEYENDDIYNAAIPDTTELEAERMYAEIGLDYETGLPAETAAMKFAAEAQGRINYAAFRKFMVMTRLPSHQHTATEVQYERDHRNTATEADATFLADMLD